LAATSAFAQVTIYGTVDAGYSNVTASNATAALYGGYAAKSEYRNVGFANNPGTSGTLTSNRIGFKGEEDLGNGLKAGFTYELGVNYGTGAGGLGGTTRQSFVHLTDASLGGISIGRQYTPLFSAGSAYDAGGANNMVAGRTVYGKHNTVFAPSLLVSTTGDTFTRASGVMYTSPTMAGVTVKVFTGKDSASNNDLPTPNTATSGVAVNSKNSGGSVSYVNGPLSLTAATHTYQNIDAKSAAMLGDLVTKANLFGASYDLGVAKLMVSTVNNTTKQTDVQNYRYKGTQFGLQAPVTPKVDLFATYGTGKSDTVENVRAYDHKAYQLGASYSLSKRTNVYYAMGHEVATLVSANTDVTIKQTAIGLRHAF